MHFQARTFLDYCQRVFGATMYHGRVLDVGSGDINGNNKGYFPGCDYWGCDIAPGPNVDIVSPCHLLPFAPGTFDVVISSECFEHDMHYARSIAKIIEMLKPGGIFVFTCASTGRAEHGTLRTTAQDSFTTQLLSDADWGNYYKNLTAEDIRAVARIADEFAYHRFYSNEFSKDLYFVGIKRGAIAPPEFADHGVNKLPLL